MPLSHSFAGPEVGIRALGVPLRIKVGGERADELAEAVREAWHDCAAPVPASAIVIAAAIVPDEVADGARADVVGETLEQVLHDLSPVVTERAITANAGHLLMLHAAAVADPSSAGACALVAPSGTGKTTSMLCLGRRFGYLSDETVAISEDLGIVSYPKPLSVLTTRGSHLKQQTAASTLGLLPAPEDPRLRGIVYLRRDPSGPVCHTRRVGILEALRLLAPQSSYLSRLRRPLHLVSDMLDAVGGLRVVDYREASSLLAVVEELVAQ